MTTNNIDRTVLVTGVGRRAGIAAAIGEALRSDGWRVLTTGWRGYDARMPWGADAEPLADFDVDLTDPNVPNELLATIKAQYGPLQALVLCHCESVDSSILDTTVASFDRHYQVNVRASWLLIKAFAEQFEAGPNAAGSGRIVAITSDHTPFNLPYGATKGALDRLVLAASVELADRGITANVVNPGGTDNGWMDDDVRTATLDRNITKRLGTSADAARLVRFLCSDEGAWINNQLLYSDGGQLR